MTRYYRFQPWPGDFTAEERVFLPDMSDGVAALPDDATPPEGATPITHAQYDTLKAAAITAIGNAPQSTDTDRITIQNILDKLDADITQAELKELALRCFRRLRRRGYLD